MCYPALLQPCQAERCLDQVSVGLPEPQAVTCTCGCDGDSCTGVVGGSMGAITVPDAVTLQYCHDHPWRVYGKCRICYGPF